MSPLSQTDTAFLVYGFAAILFAAALLIVAVPVALWLRHRSRERYLRERDARVRSMLDDEQFVRADETDAEYLSRIRANYRSRKKIRVRSRASGEEGHAWREADGDWRVVEVSGRDTCGIPPEKFEKFFEVLQ